MVGILGVIWLIGVLNIFGVSAENLSVLKRNLYFPSVILGLGFILLFVYLRIKNPELKKLASFALIVVISFDLLRFGWKFTPFTNSEYFYPNTTVIEFLKKDKSIFRIATTDSRILAPNIATYYKIQTIDGYDPLYLKSYAELIAASERGEPNINPPFGFNRIITPHNLDSKIVDLLNVKYVLSLSDIASDKFKKVFQEGETRVYENKDVLPRVFFVKEVIVVKNEQEAINVMFKDDFNPKSTAVVVQPPGPEFEGMSFPKSNCIGKAEIISYEENKVVIETENDCDAFLVFTDSFYPTWRGYTDGYSSDNLIFKTNYHFRGTLIAGGKHRIEFTNHFFYIFNL